MPKTTKTPRREAHGAARPTRDGLDGTAQFACAGCPPGILRPGRSLRPPRKRDSIQRSSALSVYGPPCPPPNRGPATLGGSESGRFPGSGGRPRGARGQAVASARSSAKLRVLLGSTGMPGPIVVVKVTFLRYLPLAAAGLSRITSSRAAP